jgi:hypothetical protein
VVKERFFPPKRADASAANRASVSLRVSVRDFPCWLLLSACAAFPPSLQARPAAVVIEEVYEWPDRAVLRCRVSQGDLLFISRSEQQVSPSGIAQDTLALGASLPWLRLGPLLTRGMLRLVSDPLGFSAWSGVFDERTGLVLDGALQTTRPGVLFMPAPEYGGVFCRPGSRGGTEYGAFGRLPLGAAAVECAVLASRPEPAAAHDEWFMTRSPFPGGDLTHVAARIVLDSPALDLSYAAGASSARFAAPGAFSTLWIRGRLPEIEGALLLSGATPGYRAPDGGCTPDASRLSATARLGRDRGRGSIEAGFSFTTAEPGFAPCREIPTRCVLRAAFSRESVLVSDRPISLVLEAEKDINRDSDGIRQETTRCASTTCLSLGPVDLAAGLGLSDREGMNLLGRLALRPSSRLRLTAEARGGRLGTPKPIGSVSSKLAVETEGRSAALSAGLQDYPLAGPPPRDPTRFLRVILSCSFRGP